MCALWVQGFALWASGVAFGYLADLSGSGKETLIASVQSQRLQTLCRLPVILGLYIEPHGTKIRILLPCDFADCGGQCV